MAANRRLEDTETDKSSVQGVGPGRGGEGGWGADMSVELSGRNRQMGSWRGSGVTSGNLIFLPLLNGPQDSEGL